MTYKKDMEKRSARFISLAWFTAYNRPLSEFWLDDEKPTDTQIELRVLDICNTAIDVQTKIIDTEEK